MNLWERSAPHDRLSQATRAVRRFAAAALRVAVLAAVTCFAPVGAQVQNEKPKAVSPAWVTAKPVAAFALEHEIDSVPDVGVPVELRLILRPQSLVEDIVVQLSTDAGLQLLSPGSELAASAATQAAPAEWVITVVPMQEGLFHVKVYAEGLMQGSRQGRSIMVPIRVGAQRTKSVSQHSPQVLSSDAEEAAGNGEAESGGKDPVAERLIRLPAEERR